MIEISEHLVRLEAVARIDKKPDGGLTLFIPGCGSVNVEAKDAKAVLNLVAPPPKADKKN